MGWRAAFIAVTTALLCAVPASAATLTVTTSGDPGGMCTGTTCTTLRAAIAEAGRLAGADVITVPAGVINVTDDYVINSQITIVGAGARTTIIDGGAKYRGFRISGEGVLQLARFTIRNGAAGGGGFADGGGIYNAGNLAIIDVRVTDSRAVRGGGIANNLGVIQADNLLVDNNVASGAGGGGIHNTGGSELANQDGWLALTDSTIFKNSATGIGGVGGIDSSGNGALITLSRTHDRRQRGWHARRRRVLADRQHRRGRARSWRATSSGRASSTAATPSPPTAASTSRTSATAPSRPER